MASTDYSKALDYQSDLLRWISSPAGSLYFQASDAVFTGFKWTSDVIQSSVRAPLEHGDTYWWPADIMQVVKSASESLPDYELDASLLPGEAGCFWMPSVGFARNAVLWTRSGLAGGVSFVWCPWVEHEQHVTPFPALSWKYGQAWEHATATNIQAVERVKESEADTRERLAWVRLVFQRFASMLLFLNQEILVAPEEQADRHTRRRAERSGLTRDAAIRVVKLRRKHGSGETHSSESREWSCQWMVRGHWRQQFYPGAQAHRPLWIAPYGKGPDDKPMKAPRSTVFVVSR